MLGSPFCDVGYLTGDVGSWHFEADKARHSHSHLRDCWWNEQRNWWRERQTRQAVLCLFKLSLLGCLLGIDECACACLVNPKPIATNNRLVARSDGKRFSDTCRVSKLNEAELVLAFSIWILPAISYSEVKDDATFFAIFKELLEASDVNLINRVNPDSAVSLLLVEIFHSLE